MLQVIFISLICSAHLRAVEGQVNDLLHTSAPWVWLSQPPSDCPFEKSTEIVGIAFTGKFRHYSLGDTWYPSWAADGNMYSPWTDGSVEGMKFLSIGRNATTGQAVIIGDDPLNLQVRNLGVTRGAPYPYGGRYPCGSLVYNGVWYYGTYCLGPAPKSHYGKLAWNWPWLGPLVGFRISTDLGRTWTDTAHTPAKPLFGECGQEATPLKIGAPHFVDFGKNMQHSPDGKAYLVAHGAVQTDSKPRYANLSWISGDQIYMLRVKPSIENINNDSKYEFFAGQDKKGKAIWTEDFTKIKPLIDWNNNCGCVTMTCNAPLKKYLMCVTDGWPTVAKMNTYILESDHITGPWKLVTYMKDFGEQAYFVNFPSKFISTDGRDVWLCYSANFSQGWNDIKLEANPPGSGYGLVLQQVKLLDSATYRKLKTE